MQNGKQRLESRVRACWRVRACAAGLCAGTQIFLFGAGAAMPLALGGAWIAALTALPAAALATAIARRALTRPARAGRLTRALYLLLSLALLLHAALALAALVSLAGQTLMVQARALWIAAAALVSVALCALTGGADRLCFAQRWALPALLLGLTLLSLPPELPQGLFPILGAGGAELGLAAACMPGAAGVLLQLLLPPPELKRAGVAGRDCPVPGTGFFLARVLTGAALGVLLLFAASVCTGTQTGSEEWGVRLRLSFGAQPRGSIPQTMIVVCQLTAIALLCVCMLSSAEQALVRALPGAKKGRMGLWALTLLLAACMAALIVLGTAPALLAAPLLVLPAAGILILSRWMGGKDA